MMIGNGFVNLKNSEFTGYLRLKKEFIGFLLDNGYHLYVDLDVSKAFIFDSGGNDLDYMTLKQLARRTKI